MDPEGFPELEAFLVSHSHLPGPRGNLELADAFARAYEGVQFGEAHWEILDRWLRISAEEAPTGDPREFLPFCAALALGAAYSRVEPERKAWILHRLWVAASDGRWRMREASAMGFQRIAERDFQAVRALFSDRVAGASFLEQRAIVAALAHPPILKDPARVTFCLQIAGRILQRLRSYDRGERKSEGFRVLRQGLEYALSVFVQHLPGEGFSFLRRWAVEEDPDLKRIVKANAGKPRLKGRYPAEVAEVLALF